MASFRVLGVFVIVWLALASGCTRAPPTGETTLKPKSVAEVQEYLTTRKVDFDEFRLRGPFAVVTKENHELRLSAKVSVKADVYLSEPKEKAPLVIFLHGYGASKEAHSFQAMHLASWGVHSISVQLPNKGPWVPNGRTLARIVSLMHASPELIDSRIDGNKIILVGHSFGGAAVSVALAEGARAIGGILLDPALMDKAFPTLLQRIKQPVLVLGADEEIASARNRDYFFYYVRSNIMELSVRDASHEDAQWPSDYALQNRGYDPSTTEEVQITFASAITTAIMSLSATGAFDRAWASFSPGFASGKFFDAKKK